jgi:hypothetical protein
MSVTAVQTKQEDAWRPEAPYKLVAVEWVDSAQPVSAWQWADDYEMPQIVVCVSVGYLIAETEDAIALAPNLGDIGRERVQASGIIRLPRAAVRKISYL